MLSYRILSTCKLVLNGYKIAKHAKEIPPPIIVNPLVYPTMDTLEKRQYLTGALSSFLHLLVWTHGQKDAQLFLMKVFIGQAKLPQKEIVEVVQALYEPFYGDKGMTQAIRNIQHFTESLSKERYSGIVHTNYTFGAFQHDPIVRKKLEENKSTAARRLRYLP